MAAPKALNCPSDGWRELADHLEQDKHEEALDKGMEGSAEKKTKKN